MAKCRQCGGKHWTRDCLAVDATAIGEPRAPDAAADHLVGIYLGDVEHFVRDALGRHPLDALPWLLAAARAARGTVTGSEDVDEVREPPLPTFVSCPFVLVARVGSQEEQQELEKRLKCLELLRFHCKASIHVFSFMGSAPKNEWSYVFGVVIPHFLQKLSEDAPQWFLPSDDTDGRVPATAGLGYPVDRVGIIPTRSTDDGVFIFLVCPPNALGHSVWTTVGGAPKRGPDGDQRVADTCRREWDEEVLAFPFDSATKPGSLVQHVVWKANSRAWKNWTNRLPLGADGHTEGVSSAAWCFVEASEEFFAETYGRTVNLVLADSEVVRKGDTPERFRLIHTEGLPFVEQELGAWFRLDMETGKLFSHIQDAVVRADLGFRVLRSQSLRHRLSEAFCSGGPCPGGHAYGHAVSVSPDGVRDKLEVLRFSWGQLSPNESSTRLATCIGNGLRNDKYHQFYSEEVDFYLKCGARADTVVPLADESTTSLLHAVLLNNGLVENVALRSCELLCGAYRGQRQMVSEEEVNDGNATRRIRFKQLPKVLIVNLKRFTYVKGKGGPQKIHKAVRYDEKLVLDKSWLVDGAESLEYFMTAVICHHGESVNRGHYTAIVRYNAEWYSYDDTTVKRVELKEVGAQHHTAYLLVYQSRAAVDLTP